MWWPSSCIRRAPPPTRSPESPTLTPACPRCKRSRRYIQFDIRSHLSDIAKLCTMLQEDSRIVIGTECSGPCVLLLVHEGLTQSRMTAWQSQSVISCQTRHCRSAEGWSWSFVIHDSMAKLVHSKVTHRHIANTDIHNVQLHSFHVREWHCKRNEARKVKRTANPCLCAVRHAAPGTWRGDRQPRGHVRPREGVHRAEAETPALQAAPAAHGDGAHHHQGRGGLCGVLPQERGGDHHPAAHHPQQECPLPGKLSFSCLHLSRPAGGGGSRVLGTELVESGMGYRRKQSLGIACRSTWTPMPSFCCSWR